MAASCGSSVAPGRLAASALHGVRPPSPAPPEVEAGVAAGPVPPAPRGSPGPGERLLLGGARGALAGAWCGAAAGPLDWGRAWQAWPVPQAWGAAAGFLLGALLALALGGGGGARATPRGSRRRRRPE